MKSSPIKPTLILYYAIIALGAFLVLMEGWQTHIRVNFTQETLFSLDDGWLYIASDGSSQQVDLPAHLDTHGSHSVILTNKIPDHIQNVNTIGILTDNQSLSAYLEGKQIYSREAIPDRGHLFNLPIGSIWDIIYLPEEFEGKTLTLVFESKYDDKAGKVGKIYFGTKASILIHNIKTYGLGFVLSILISILGFLMLGIYLLIRRLIDPGKSIYYLGWFLFLSSIWLLTESNLSQLFISNPFVISALCYLSLLALPLPLLFHVSELEGYHFKLTNRMQITLMLACNIILILLQFFNLADFHEALLPYQIILLTIFAASMITLWISLVKYKENNLKLITYAFTLLFVFTLLEFLNYALLFFSVVGFFFRVGLYLFMFTLIADGTKKAIDVIKLSETASRYKLLATRDPLTNCRSRSKYMRDMEKIDLSKNITLFMADMNNMKEINDTFGHHAGDEVVILCSQCLMKVFGHRVYRIGGDEFLCIEYDLSISDIKYRLAAFTMESDRINADGPYHIDVSIGYATYDPELDASIYDTVNRADAMMYQIKDKLKELRSVHF